MRAPEPLALNLESLLRAAMELPTSERAALADDLIESLDRPDPVHDALWLKEAEDRLAAYRRGELGAIDASQVFADLTKELRRS